ncbi:hypothetical protein C5F49_00760 [Nitrosopumilus oxyclinae]|uniref:NodB homology domain-containing protein n=1 Tax=Nitrosopumilus oxyclinae TaxID=1959104 RepID=A0A7D5M214_9ARCH|nr:hypothetical protein [Nitrosopumilus oxyclinae]QLH04015.1 hypothetical protein C5F49_00760 [Nitrosopumilus oxyclinae]
MFVITLDCDWVPDFILDDVVNLFNEKNVKAVFFITNDSPTVQKLRKNPLFEVGIHPNFFPNSSHGNDIDSVLKYLKEIIPEAKSIRTHGLYQSTPLLKKFQEYGIENDVSILLSKTPNLTSHYSKFFNLYRFPYFWEDDVEMDEEYKWSLDNPLFHKEGLKIFNFHPIHVYLNSRKMNQYNSLKEEVGLNNVNENNIKNYINKNKNGAKDFLEEIISHLENKDTFTIQNLKKKISI